MGILITIMVAATGAAISFALGWLFPFNYGERQARPWPYYFIQLALALIVPILLSILPILSWYVFKESIQPFLRGSTYIAIVYACEGGSALFGRVLRRRRKA